MKNWRLITLSVFFFGIAAIIIGRLFYVQTFNHKYYKSQALGQQTSFKEIEGERGEIFFQNSRESGGNYGSGDLKSLAINEERWTVSVFPREIADKDNFAEILSKYIDISKSAIALKLEGQSSYIVIKKDLSAEAVKELKNIQIEGLLIEKTVSRYYPQQELASQVIGFLGGENSGQYGIEGYYDNILKGEKGLKESKKGINSADYENNQKYLDGSDIFLTMDYNIQFQAESLLREAKKNIDIDSGQIIVLKPDSGRILALANFPSFDPNEYSMESNFDIFQNSAIQKLFEPGSVFKPFTMAMALNEGKISSDSTFTDTGFVKIGPDIVYNFDKKTYGQQTLSGILEKSINTGAVFLSSLLSRDGFFGYLNKFSFTKATEVDLQGEVYSKNEILRTGSDFGFATASFGQGVEMTPIQLAAAFSIFANGGKMIKPYIVEKTIRNQTEIRVKPQILDSVISPKTAEEVTKMLTNVVERGFGSAAKIKGYYMAGKTGTAEVPIENGRGYYSDRTIQSFIGFGPALNPKFLILVKLDNPKVSQSALSAAPIFKKLSQYIINYWQIPPDY